MRTLLAISIGCTIGAVSGSAIAYLGARSGSVAIAVLSALVCVWYAVKAVHTDRERTRRMRDAAWQRRIETGLVRRSPRLLLPNGPDVTYYDRQWRPIETIHPEERHGL